MAVQTPIANSQFYTVIGSQRQECAKFLSVANNDTFTSQLSIIVAFSFDGGGTGANIGATWVNGVGGAGATVTFLTSGSAVANCSWAAVGY